MNIWREIVDWANANEGFLALIAILLTAPSLALLVYQGFRRMRPTSAERQKKATEEFAHAETLKSQVDSRTKRNEVSGFFGELIIRDIERKLTRSEEKHSSVDTPYSIAELIDIHPEHLEFTTGSLGRRYIKRIADCWYFSEATEEGAIKVDVVFWLNYRDIAFIRWETDDYWDRPQVCCRFTDANKFPLSRIYYAEEKTGGQRPFYSHVCLLGEVSQRPTGIS